MDKPQAPADQGGLGPNSERWARRLAQVQNSHDELVRLLGLLRVLGGIATSLDSLEGGGQAICRHLVNYLGLSYCGFFVRQEGRDTLRASHGQEPLPEVLAMLCQRIEAGNTFAGQVEQDGGGSYLACLPLTGAQGRLGGLAMVLEQRMDTRLRRHLAMVTEAVAPVLENFILRGYLQEFNQCLRQESRRAARSLAELSQAHLESASCLAGLMAHDQEPLLVIDAKGCLLRVNPALEALLGWQQERIVGRGLGEFLSRPQDWEPIGHWLASGESELRRRVPLRVQCGMEVEVNLSLRRYYRGQQEYGALGRLSRLETPAQGDGGLFSAREVEELARRCSEVGNQINNLLAALRAHLQLALLDDLGTPLRRRLEILEMVAEDSKGVARQANDFAEQLRQRARRASAQAELWPQEKPASHQDGD